MSAPAPIVRLAIPASARPVEPSPVFGTPRGDLLAACILSAVAGYVDAAGFLGLFGLFAAHVTGDLVAVGTTVAGAVQEGLGLRLTAILVFMISVAAAAFIARATARRGHQPLGALLALMTLALALFCATGVKLQSHLQDPDDWAVVLVGAVGVFGMGVQNALARDALRGLGPTTLMTGNLTQLMVDLVDVALPRDATDPWSERGSHRTATLRRLARSATSVLAFLLGTVLGGVATTRFGFWSIALPTALVGALTISIWLPSRARDARAPVSSRRGRAARNSGIQMQVKAVPEVDQLGSPVSRSLYRFE